MFQVTPRLHFMKLFFDNRPRAFAEIKGDLKHPKVRGAVYFYEVENGGILIEAEIFGLPNYGGTDMPAFLDFTSMKTETVPEIFPKREPILIRKIKCIRIMREICRRLCRSTGMHGRRFTTMFWNYTILSGVL